MEDQESQFVYWEKQGKDRMCGLHAINSILQGPTFHEGTLSEIANRLDQAEKALLEDPSMEKQASINVSYDGNYNIQVL